MVGTKVYKINHLRQGVRRLQEVFVGVGVGRDQGRWGSAQEGGSVEKVRQGGGISSSGMGVTPGGWDEVTEVKALREG